MQRLLVLGTIALLGVASFAHAEPKVFDRPSATLDIDTDDDSDSSASNITEGRARQILQEWGFSKIIDLKPSDDGWTAKVLRGGAQHTVTIDDEDGAVEITR